jgi:peptidoglycan/xylan/chitin deacetylase (PgdA/CDA1 family)
MLPDNIIQVFGLFSDQLNMKRPHVFSLFIFVFIASCGLFKTSTSGNIRTISSIEIEQVFSPRVIDEKLHQLFIYYLIAQRELDQFDKKIPDLKIEEIYSQSSYLKLQTIRSQSEDIENHLLELHDHVTKIQKSNSQKSTSLLNTKVKEFSEQSSLHALFMENISHRLMEEDENQKLNFRMKSRKEINKYLKTIEESSLYQVLDKNIEHLSFMLEGSSTADDKKFYPSSASAGNITGNEFPAKVWSLTFDDGPKRQTSEIILNELKKRNLKATFFQLTQQVKKDPEMAKEIHDSGMEIASHSYTHPQLTKVTSGELDFEIGVATAELRSIVNAEIHFFRLPYGAGVLNPTIREKVAGENLIHAFWNIDTLDWMAQEPEKIVERTIQLMKKTQKDSGIILFHDIHRRTTLAAPVIMDLLLQENRRVCTLHEIVSQINEGNETVCAK